MSQKTSNSKIAKIVEIGLKKVTTRLEDVEALESVAVQIKCGQNSDKIFFEKLLHTSIVLVKAKTVPIDSIPHDYDLQQYCKKEITIIAIDGDHFSLIDNPIFADIISEEFSTFKNENTI